MAAVQAAAQSGVAMTYNSPLDVVKQTLSKEGPRAFYKGWLPQFLRASPYSVIQFAVWEKLMSAAGMHAV